MPFQREGDAAVTVDFRASLWEGIGVSGNRHVHRALHRNRLAFEAHSDACEWPKGCTAPSRWYYTTISGRFSLCDAHCPVEYRTDPIRTGESTHEQI